MKGSKIHYRFPYNLSKALEKETNCTDCVSGSRESDAGKMETITGHLSLSRQRLSKAFLNLLQKIAKDTHLSLSKDEYSKWFSFIKDFVEVQDIEYFEESGDSLRFRIGKDICRLSNQMNKTNMSILIEREDPQVDGAAQNLINGLDGIIKEMDLVAYKYISDNGKVRAFKNANKGFSNQMKGFLGVDVGSVSTNVAFVDENQHVIETVYTYTRGRVLDAIKTGLKEMMAKLPANAEIMGVGVTGSSGELAKSILNADIYKTEIYSHAAATIHQIPDVKTILEIGGQDSKVIYVNNGIPEKSKMNEWCGAGTGAMLDSQAHRLGLTIQEFSELAVKAKKSIDFRTRCGVFMDSCMIDAQAKGYPIEVIIRGLCNACAHNFISTLGINRKSIEEPIAFQGGVSANMGVKKELEDYISEAKGEKVKLIVPLHHDVMGAIGMAMIVGKLYQKTGKPTSFRGLDEIERIIPEVKECAMHDCPKSLGIDRRCDIVKLKIAGATIAAIGACDEYVKEFQSDAGTRERRSEMNIDNKEYRDPVPATME
jgi:predicted CoA-substrate-specific enzyme activase